MTSSVLELFLGVDVKTMLYKNGIAIAVVPRGMTLALQFVDLYFFAYFKRVYADELEEMLEGVEEKLSIGEKRIMMTKCVARAWKKVIHELPTERLFRELGYIWSKNGESLKVPVLRGYKYDPLLALPDVHVPLRPCEQRERELMEKEDMPLASSSAPLPLPTPRLTGLKQATLPW